MYMFSNYTIEFDGASQANKECAAWLSGELGIGIDAGSQTHVKEDGVHNNVEDLWDWLEPYASAHSEASLKLEGRIDGSSGSGELEDFKLVISEGRVIGYRSGWYTEAWKGSYEDYDEFCEDFENADGTPICTREQFDAFEGEFIKMMGSPAITIYDKVPLSGPIASREDLPKCGLM